ncbi:MAG: hypothetical protein UW07_C0024G0007 [Candidatus Nomurabacteria bacterium GW2011_GWF2_43_8]|uniref:Uncharacterized protein n=3 Tax=Candidatus Nomuraibacteriota TaxID=1752729 RepID=A0A0G1FLY6_9BACT|nr:MAG: hypothetical protein UV76_C0011G0006 [Candidatus Nomurabacteria bacterium GW2011_GWA2_43_15]KKT19047.1 MAG: hypothetical protein UW02_C0016G0021 [Candidatus Nomurabacteria bacterium GW2011_GWB1_43_7]KKT23431.1 MAG: hypothetical protein UW07_C0024G0007 [Candidatus Nomurabacteria bacterium GW2011_GWF2_43_8]
MDPKRQGEIALLFFKMKLREQGIKVAPALLRQLGNTAKTLGISINEASEFVEMMVRELVDEVFAESKK